MLLSSLRNPKGFTLSGDGLSPSAEASATLLTQIVGNGWFRRDACRKNGNSGKLCNA